MAAAKPSPKPLKERSTWAGAVFGLWIGALYAVVIAGRIVVRGETEGVFHIAALVAAILWPLGYFLFSRNRFIPGKIRTGSLVALAVFLLFCLLSSFGSPVTLNSVSFTVLTLAGVWIALQFISCMDGAQFETGLKVYALVIIAVLLAFAAYDYVPGTRLGEGRKVLNPNAIAMVSISAALCSMAIRNWLLRYGLMMAVFVVLYLTGSRASSLATLIGLAVIGYERTRSGGGNVKILVLLGLALGIGALAVLWDSVWPAIEGFLQLKSRHRGIESGASGRSIVWNETWQLFLDNPAFGIGFRAHETILGVSAHNGYLAMLAEIGIAGFVAILYLILSGIFLLWRKVRQPEWTFSHSILFGLCCGYLFLAMFERFLINVGNPTSLLFLVATLAAVGKAPRPAFAYGSFSQTARMGVRATRNDAAFSPGSTSR